MSTKKDKRDQQHRSLLLNLEDSILALENFGMTEQDIFSLANMVMRGFIRNGIVTEEYLMLARQAQELQQQRELNELPGILGTDGQPIRNWRCAESLTAN